MRNNNDRISVPESEADIAAQMVAMHQTQMAHKQEQEQVNNFGFVAPTEFVRLPSAGKFYTQDHPLFNQEYVEIRYMTAKDEDILTSKTLLKQGVAIDRLIESVVTNKRIKARELLSGDKNAILIATRNSGYGPEYTTKITCPSCKTVTENSFDMSELEFKETPDFDELKVRETEVGTFIVSLPRTKADVEVRLLTGKDEAEMMANLERKEKRGLPLSPLTSQLNTIIVSINGITDKMSILQFVENMPSFDSRHLREVYSKVVPNVDLRQHFDCPRCGHEEEVDIPITADFFWSK